ncbi:invasin domain 3-containing protein [Chitinophaga japonensis]|uniref:Invasin domain-containing protein n=1 Tax=Chitinophaga japonensis TaxID=104662 RepID=A0A562T960_CHIJA|nr:invasin domain 3-containing protein [Chitinophaga japonensis]TWI89330.1 hypothetical protein LX66_3426 [Chitinophaga japonensis]
MQHKPYILLCLFIAAVMGCEKDVDTYTIGGEDGPAVADIIRFSGVSSLQLEADSSSTSVLTVQLHPEADAANRDVQFKTSLGTFENGDTVLTVKANASGVASATLLSDQAGTAKVSAEVKSIRIDTTLVFQPAAPDDILLSADAYRVDTNTSVNVTTQLFRNPGRGKVTSPVKVFFTVTAPDTATYQLVYPAFAFSEEKAATITISNPFKQAGAFRIASYVLSAQNDTLRKEILIAIQ